MKSIQVFLRTLIIALLFSSNLCFAENVNGLNLDLGDHSSQYLIQKAWVSLTAKDYKTAAAYANKTIELYSEKAGQMQGNLKEYPSGDKSNVFKYWALNDVGTALFILGESYRNLGQQEESKATFRIIIDKFYYSQCWEPQGWFWKIAEVAKDKLDMAQAGVNIDFGNYDSNTLVQKAWVSSAAKDLKETILYVNKIVELYGDKAQEMQKYLKEHEDSAWKRNEKDSDYWALNDVGTALFVLAETYRKTGHHMEAKALYRKVVNEYSYAKCWDRQGWFWKPSDAAKKRI